ncbi:MAG: hypothetical protein HYZ74_03635, partial [Elusimicrobia bacterium]|nr:hypothetical protein [Elusimicrobiota bacterium]
MKVIKRFLRPAAWAIVALVAVAGESFAAGAPNLLTYQGRLKEVGQPVTGARDITIQLCDSLTAGNCFTTGVQGVSVVNGLFRTTFTVPSTVALESGPWYIEVIVAGQAFSPREMLSATPYAIYASSAATLSPMAGAQLVQISTTVSIQAKNAAGYSLVLSSGISMPQGTVTAKYFSGSGAYLTGIASNDNTKVLKSGDSMSGGLNIINNALTLTGPGGHVISAGSVTANSLIVGVSTLTVSAGLIGMGTASPQARLDIVSTGAAANVYAQIWRDSGNVAQASMSATGVLYADGSGLRNLPAGFEGVDNSRVLKAGDTMTGQLTLSGSSLTVTGSEGVGITYGLSAGSGSFTTGVTAVSGSFTGLTAGSGTFTDSGSTQYSVMTASGIKVLAGGVRAAFFEGNDVRASSAVLTASGDQVYSLVTSSGINVLAGGVKASFFQGDSLSVGVSTLSVGAGLIGMGTTNPLARLDVVSTGTAANVFAQIWRDSSNVAQASMSATGVIYADGSGLRNLPPGFAGVDSSKVLKTGDTMTGSLVLRDIASAVKIQPASDPAGGTKLLELTDAAGHDVAASGAVTVTGGVTAASFSGDGAALTNITGANITGNIGGQAATVVNGVYTTAANTLTNTSAPVLIKPSAAPSADTKLLDLQGTGAGTTVFSVDEAGDVGAHDVAASGAVTVTGGVTAASFSGDGAALTNITGANITGNIGGQAATVV